MGAALLRITWGHQSLCANGAAKTEELFMVQEGRGPFFYLGIKGGQQFWDNASRDNEQCYKISKDKSECGFWWEYAGVKSVTSDELKLNMFWLRELIKFCSQGTFTSDLTPLCAKLKIPWKFLIWRQNEEKYVLLSLCIPTIVHIHSSIKSM